MKRKERTGGLVAACRQQNLRSILTRASVICLMMNLLIGCTPVASTTSTSGEAEHKDEHHHDHGHRPESYSSAVRQIKVARDDVKAAFDAGTPESCDEALHILAEVLVALPEVAAETDLPKEDWQTVKDQSKILFDNFMMIHNGFHGGGAQGVSFDSVCADIDAAIEALESKLAATGETNAHEVHEHPHGDHELEKHEHEHEHEHDHDNHDP